MRLLVVGDYINDAYTFGRATRLCPEAPVPVIVPEKEVQTDGGAGLVYRQLQELGADVHCYYGSYSTKRRYFAGSHLICRLDEDSHKVEPLQTSGTYLGKFDAFVVSDYSKGAMTPTLADQIIGTGKPCFIDAKHHWEWYEGPYSRAFPNEHEQPSASRYYEIAHKLGANGCKLWCETTMRLLCLPATVSEVVDTTGAGDIFMAGFVYAWTLNLPAEDCLRFANEIAGESCRHIGTYVVPREFAQSVLYRLRPSQASGQQSPASFPGSTPTGMQRQTQQDRDSMAWNEATDGTPPVDYWEGTRVPRTIPRIPLGERIRPQSPLGPTESNGAQSPGGSGLNADGMTEQMKRQNLNPSATADQYGHTQAQDQVLRPKKA